MKLYLAGGFEKKEGCRERFFKMVENIILETGVGQVLMIPYARVEEREDGSFKVGDYYKMYNFEDQNKIKGVEYLNVLNDDDLKKVKKPLIYVWGGSKSNKFVVDKIRENKRLSEIVNNCDYYIGDSVGAMLAGDFLRCKDEIDDFAEGLGFLKNTIIEPHYKERNREGFMKKAMEDLDIDIGIGIDSLSVMKFDLEDYPDKYDQMGEGDIVVLRNKKLKV